MTGDLDVNKVTPGLDRLQLQQQRRHQDQVDQEFPGLSNGASASSAHVPDQSSSSESSPTSQPHEQTWSAMLNANARPFSPKQKGGKGKGKGKSNQIKVELDPELEKQLKRLQSPNTKMIILMRGLPGSGKSTLADYLSVHYEGHIISADSFFMKSGYYCFDPQLLGYAHEYAQKRAEDWARINAKLIIVDNTNLESWEMMPYARIAEKCGYLLVFAEPKTAWKYTPRTLAKKNSHGVTANAIEQSLRRFDRYITPVNLLARLRAESGAFRQLVSPLPSARNAPHDPSCHTAEQHAAGPSPPPEMPHDTDPALLPAAVNPNQKDPVAMEISPSNSDDDVIEVTNDNDCIEVPPSPSTIREKIAAGAKVCADQFSNWAIPAFPAQMHLQKEMRGTDVVVRDSSSQTVVHDFAELELGEDIICLGDEADGESGSSSDQRVGEEYVSQRYVTTPVVMDKGTSICAEELGDLSLDEKIEELKQEFPLATREHIVEVLVACQQNHLFAEAILQGFDDDHFEDLILEDINYEAAADESSGEDREPDLQMELNVDLAARLEKKFGSIPGEAFDNLRFTLKEGLARSLYEAWYQATAGQSAPKRVKPVKLQADKVKTPATNSLSLTAPTGTLQEIMQYEEALERSKEEERASAWSYDLKLQLAQRKHLYGMFPGAPPESLDAVLEANNYNVHEAAIQIKSSTLQSGCETEVQYLTALKSKGNRSFPPISDCGQNELRIPLDTPPSKALMSKSMPQLREEMLALYKLRRQYMEKARRCCSSKQYMVTTYYRQEAEDVDRRIEKLAQAICIKSLEVQGFGNVLDLHFLHVREALCVLKCFLELKRKELKTSAHKHTFVEVITGYGASGTVPKIKPQVESYLKSKKYAFAAKNEGCFMVTLAKNGRK